MSHLSFLSLFLSYLDVYMENHDKNYLLKYYLAFCPKNTKGVYLDEYSVFNSEKEFLMPRNLKFKLLDTDYKNQVLKMIEENFYNRL